MKLQILDWNDICIFRNNYDDESDEEEENENYNYLIQIFGKNKEGKSICINVYNVFPYFYVKHGFFQDLNINKFFYHEYSIVNKKSYSSFKNDMKERFIKISFKSPIFLNKIKKTLENKYELFESNVNGIIQFIHDNELSGSSWININDDRFKIPGVIEMSNLRPLKGNIVYIPFYMPKTNPDYTRENKEFISDAWYCLKQINKGLKDNDLINSYCNRYEFAQPICETGHLKHLPPINPLKGIYIIDTTAYYPEDRGISESIEYGKKIAHLSVK